MHFPALVELTCREVTELAREYMAASGLSRRQRAHFEQHLHACTWCMTYLKQLEQTARDARRLADDNDIPEAPAGLLELFRRTTRSTPTGPAIPTSIGPRIHPPTTRIAPQRHPAARTATGYALKFLARDAAGPLSDFRWPRPERDEPGAWVEIAGPLVPCAVGIHATTPGDLAHWLHDELWLIELGGEVRRGTDSLVAARGRLVRELSAWRDGGALRFAQATHARAHAVVHGPATPSPSALRCLASAARHLPLGNVALSAFCSAMAIARVVGATRFDQSAYDAERRAQSAWITRELALDAQLAEAATGRP